MLSYQIEKLAWNQHLTDNLYKQQHKKQSPYMDADLLQRNLTGVSDNVEDTVFQLHSIHELAE